MPPSLPRDNTICRRVVDTGVPCQIFDLAGREHDPAAQHAFREFGARSYIGVPITADGVAIGTVATIDFEPKFVDSSHQQMLCDVAVLAVTEMRLRLIEMGSGKSASTPLKANLHEGASASFKNFTKEHLRVLQAISDAVLAINRSGEITFVNPAAERMLGRPAGSLVGSSLDKIRHVAEPEGRCAIRKSIEEGHERIIRSLSFVHGSGRVFPVEIISSPVSAGLQTIGTMLICRDASHSKDLKGLKLRKAFR